MSNAVAPAPVVAQPAPPGGPGQGTQWAAAPQAPAGCPPGLEYLSTIDQVLVKQKVEIFEAMTGYETNNKYDVLNSMGQRIYEAKEDTCCCTRNCMGSIRPFDIKIENNQMQEVIHLSRPCRCSSCFFPCCLQRLDVEAPPGSLIGQVKQAWHPCGLPRYKVQNTEGETQLEIKGPCCTCAICGDLEFEVVSAADNETKVGVITKQWSGFAKEAFTDADNFGVRFPLDLEVKTKATTMGAVFLIDFMYFESDGGDKKMKNHHHVHF